MNKTDRLPIKNEKRSFKVPGFIGFKKKGGVCGG